MRRNRSGLFRALIGASVWGIAVAWMLSLAVGQTAPEVRVIADFIQLFNTATISKPVAEVSINDQTCGGVSRKSIFHHPVGGTSPSTVSYTVALPRISEQGRLFFAVNTGLSDDIDWSKREADGVQFQVRAEGQLILDQTMTTSGSHPFCIDVSRYQNQRVRFDFITLIRGNPSYDWASWGEPRLLLFNGTLSMTGKTIPIAAGVLAFQHDAAQPLVLTLSCADASQLIKWNYRPDVASTGTGLRWSTLDFNFHNVTSVTLNTEPATGIRSTLVGYYSLDVTLDYITPGVALVYPQMLLPLRYKVTNRSRGFLPADAAQVVVYDSGGTLIGHSSIPSLERNAEWMGDILWTIPNKTGRTSITGKLMINDPHANLSARTASQHVIGSAGEERIVSFDVVSAPNSDHQGSRWLDNGKMRIVFGRQEGGLSYAKIYSRNGETWDQVAVWKPLARINLNTPQGPVVWEPAFTQVFRGRNADSSERYTNSWQFVTQTRDCMNNLWNITMTATLDNNASDLDIAYTWRTEGAPSVQSLLGPNIYVGDGTFGGSKTGGLFPGLEYLNGAEPSSSKRDFAPEIADRRSPISDKITIPLMAISWAATNQSQVLNPGKFFCPDSTKDYWSAEGQPQKTIGLYWDLSQKWDGIHGFPTPRFSSPNNDEGMMNHRFALFLPSIPDMMIENQNGSYSWTLSKGTTYSLNAQLAITDGPILSSVRHYLDQHGGLPATTPWPRSAAQERALCRTGFDTVWDGTNKWSHCVDWPPAYAPGFATLLWADALSSPAYPRNSEASLNALTNILTTRIQPVVEAILTNVGPSGLCLPNNCHILRWEFPFHYGYLEEAWGGLDQQMKQTIASQAPDGSWSFQPTEAKQKNLGQAGDATMGTVANKAAILLRYARITGDAECLAAGLKALDFINRFAVPRGGQLWECPMYQPDILPAAYTMKACVDAWALTGDSAHLAHAIRWAETGIPFIYLWSYPNKPMMLGATIPVFGSTFYSHTWLSVPVQWNGLVYSYELFHLIEALEKLQSTGQPLPKGDLAFTPNDWKTIVSHILASAVQQQCTDGNLIGTYPDSIGNFEKRNPAFINPEDILVNQLAVEGADPDIHTAILSKTVSGYSILSAVATLSDLKTTPNEQTFNLSYYKGCNIHAMITDVSKAPATITVNQKPLVASQTPLRTEPGWHYNAETRRLYITAPNLDGKITLVLHYE